MTTDLKLDVGYRYVCAIIGSSREVLTSAVTYSPYVFHPLYYLPTADDYYYKEVGPYVLFGEYYCHMGCYHGGMLTFASLVLKQWY